MNAEHFEPATFEAINRLQENLTTMNQMEAEKAIRDQFDAMKQDGRLMLMTDEEERLIRAFRRFKMNAKKNGEVFKWQTRLCDIAEMDKLIAVEDTQLISDPQDISA